MCVHVARRHHEETPKRRGILSVRRKKPSTFARSDPRRGMTDVWRTADRRPLCYHCGEANHICRRCPYRQMELRGFDPNDPRPSFHFKATRGIDDRMIRTSTSRNGKVSTLTMGAMGSFSPYDGDLTVVGRVMAQLPLDVRISKTNILGFVLDCLEDCIVIGKRPLVLSPFLTPNPTVSARGHAADL
ncbi:hypothetical protein HPB47_007012 [Ixodes persulcatus]|uniref:Uncharacterized protein n=1 Tax=Ixodes persulcatus TaxID=34615 RepID=A0AC60P8T4_IXOPE|nr:hypothetical protein HPB47_007012 [Ixodes persulcatus]